MKNALPLLVFTDLDGTFLDHQTYDWSPAKPAIAALKAMGAGLILASSKTAVEIAELRTSLDMEQWPSIVENGAGLLPAHLKESLNVGEYEKLRELLDAVPIEFRKKFSGFGDMTDAKVSEITGLCLNDAKLARRRAFSEPGVWHGSSQDKAQFVALLEERGVRVQQGGRFMTLSFGANKADKLRTLTQDFKPEKTIALGDAPNDVEMLETADVGVIIANPHSSPLPLLKGEDAGQIIRTSEAGPVGWNRAVLELIPHESQ